MSIARLSFALGLVIVSLAGAAGCSADVSDADTSSNASAVVTLAGRLHGGTTSTRTFGGVRTDGGALHVSARELHARGASGRTLDVLVSADGTFRVEVARGARWIVTVDDADGGSAIVTFGGAHSAIQVRAGDGNATVEVGTLRVVGGEARSDVVIDGKFGLEATVAGLDEVFLAANGALTAADEALKQAHQAAEQATKAAEAAGDAASKAADEAAAAAAAAAAGK